MKLKKRIAAMGAAVVMAVSMMSIGASAYNVSETGLANFEWYKTSAMIKNNSNTSRYMETHINVYRDNTGEYVTTLSATAAGGYGTYAKKTNNYSASSYNFAMWGDIYNSSTPMSGLAWSSGYKYIG